MIGQAHARDQSAGNDEHDTAAVGRERRLTHTAAGWYFSRLRVVELANEQAAPAMLHATHRDGAAIRRDRRATGQVIRFDVWGEADIEVRHVGRVCGGTCPARNGPSGKQQRGGS